MLTIRPFTVAALLIWALAALVVGLTGPPSVWAASPTPAEPGVGDPRSSGEGPGFVGDPLTAILIVLAIGLGSVLATALYVRLTRPAAPK